MPKHDPGDHNHPHDRAHGHDPAHGHEHAHRDEHPAHERDDAGHHHHDHSHGMTPEPLPRGAGQGKLLFLDCFSGIAGDMTIAALLDLGVPSEVVRDAVGSLPLGGYRLAVGHAHHSGIVATRFDVLVEAPQPERTFADIDALLAEAALEPDTRELARRIFRRLAEAEAAVHRVPIEEVHFHEVGAVDAIVDVVGAAAGISYLAAEVVCSPLPMGRGFVRARHGVLPLPAPATVSCLRGAPTYGVDLDAELVTPTGAAIAGATAARFLRWPSFAPERVGFGAGQAELADRPNLLRVILGAPQQASAQATHVLVEANVDDMSGELAANAIAQLIAAGALDAWAAPATMKKGRPGLVIAALAVRARAEEVARAMLRETSTIGVRKSELTRSELPRRTVTVTTRYGAIPLKVAEQGDADLAHAKPEFDACAAAAREHGVPVRLVVEEALSVWRSRG